MAKKSSKTASQKGKCIRNIANWASIKLLHRFDNARFNPKAVSSALEEASPKIAAMLKLIKQLDERDMKEFGTHFKHFIYSDVKGSNGAKIITSALISQGWHLCMKPSDNGQEIEMDIKSGKDNFILLTATLVWGLPVTQKIKKNIVGARGMFNSRPTKEDKGNVHGEKIRIVVADQGFREGVDLFDIKYVHVLEPQMSDSDLKQVIGRATRTCGQKGLNFNPNSGWILTVYVYNLILPPNKHGVVNIHSLAIKVGKVDLSQIILIEEMTKLTIASAVDGELNNAINNYHPPPTPPALPPRERLVKPLSLPKIHKSHSKLNRPLDIRQKVPLYKQLFTVPPPHK